MNYDSRFRKNARDFSTEILPFFNGLFELHRTHCASGKKLREKYNDFASVVNYRLEKKEKVTCLKKKIYVSNRAATVLANDFYAVALMIIISLVRRNEKDGW